MTKRKGSLFRVSKPGSTMYMGFDISRSGKGIGLKHTSQHAKLITTIYPDAAGRWNPDCIAPDLYARLDNIMHEHNVAPKPKPLSPEERELLAHLMARVNA